MLLRHVALVSQTNRVKASTLHRVSAALQKQATRDFGPLWGIRATVDSFATLHDMPLDYWPIIIRDDINQPGAAGVHMDQDGQPFALVQYDATWSLTTSHECLEMLADPFGSRVIAGQSVKPGQGRVRYLVEVCDPCEAPMFSYRINGIRVSDFYTPHFFDPTGAPGVRYSYTGAITQPRQVLTGGYLSWKEMKTGHWWQLIMDSDGPQYRDLGVLAMRGSIRETIDRMTPRMGIKMDEKKMARPAAMLQMSTEEDSREAMERRADALNDQIRSLLAGEGMEPEMSAAVVHTAGAVEMEESHAGR